MTLLDAAAGPAQSRPGRTLAGTLRPPGDKSVSHRALIFGAMAEGETRITGLLESDDVLRTADAMRLLGAHVSQTGPGIWRVAGVGARGFTSPARVLDFGNSGTGCRLSMGAAAGHDIEARFSGDESLRARPMERVLAPLRALGAGAWSEDDRLPVRIRGRRPLRAGSWIEASGSAQVKSAYLIAALSAEGECEFLETRASRDHTERMLPAFGAALSVEEDGAKRLIHLAGPVTLTGCATDVPSDPSSAAFLAVAAAVTPGGEVTLTDVMMNPTRTGLYETLAEMGADLTLSAERIAGGEPAATLRVRSGSLKGVAVDPARVASMIDEFPILAVAAAFAEGETKVAGAKELRVKESDRIAAVVRMLRVNGVQAEEREDGFVVNGCGAAGVPGGGTVTTFGDHRIAMSALVLGLAAKAPVRIDDASMIATSYPGFFDDLRTLGADVARVAA